MNQQDLTGSAYKDFWAAKAREFIDNAARCLRDGDCRNAAIWAKLFAEALQTSLESA